MKNKKILSVLLSAAIIAATLLTVFCLPAMTAAAAAETIVVTNPWDTVFSDLVSLRQAVAQAREGDTITFNLPKSGDYNTTTGMWIVRIYTEIPITKSLTIDGGGKIILDASYNQSGSSNAARTRIFNYDITSTKAGPPLTLKGLALRFGRANGSGDAGRGGAIITSTNQSVVAIDCEFGANIAQGSASSYGGAIFSKGNITLENCFFMSNEAFNDGAVNAWGYISAVNTSFLGNYAHRDDGKGATMSATRQYLVHCTIAKNASYGVYNGGGDDSDVYLYNCLLGDNSPGNYPFPYTVGPKGGLNMDTEGTSYFGSNSVTNGYLIPNKNVQGILRADPLRSKTTLSATGPRPRPDGQPDPYGLSAEQQARILEVAKKDQRGQTRGYPYHTFGAYELVEPVVNVTVSPASKTIKAGETATLKATVSPTYTTHKEVAWSSSDTKIVTVDSSGKVIAKAVGTANITALALDGSGRNDFCKITVTPAPIKVTKVTLSNTAANMIVGNTRTLKVTITPANAANKAVTWSSSNTKVAKVNQSGKVTAVGTGSVTIKATAKDGSKKSASSAITVHQYVTMRIGKTTAIQNGIKTSIDAAGTKPFTISGKTVLPLRFVGEKMGGKVKYISDSQPITLSYGNTKVEFRLGDKKMKVTTGSNTQTVTLDVPAQKVGGKTYVPLRAISQALGFDVFYEAGTEYIVVNNPKMTTAVKNARLAEAKSIIK